MNIDSELLPTCVQAGGATIQGLDWGGMNVAQIRFPKGTDAGPLLNGMPQNLCPCPHWGVVQKGSIHVRYADGREEVVREGSVYYWPPGHTVRVDEDYEAIEFSPAEEMNAVLSHLRRRIDELTAGQASAPH